MASIYSWESFIRIHGGEPGARDVFEKAMDELLRAENPGEEVHIVKASQGDGGIDVYVHHEDGIDIYQCKFFMGSLNPSRWSQIKNSFSKAMEPKGVKVLRWVLCMPREMQKEDIAEWDEFKKDRKSKDVEIQFVDGNQIIYRMRACDRDKGTDLIEWYFGESKREHKDIKKLLFPEISTSSTEEKIKGLPSIRACARPTCEPYIESRQRKADLDNIGDMLLNSKQAIWLYGEGGIGKTELILRYAEKNPENIYIFTKFKGSINQTVSRNLFFLPGYEMQGVELQDIVRYERNLAILSQYSNALRSEGHCLVFVIDNYDPDGYEKTFREMTELNIDTGFSGEESDKQSIQKLISLGVRVILTTRTIPDNADAYKTYEVKPMEEKGLLDVLIGHFKKIRPFVDAEQYTYENHPENSIIGKLLRLIRAAESNTAFITIMALALQNSKLGAVEALDSMSDTMNSDEEYYVGYAGKTARMQDHFEKVLGFMGLNYQDKQVLGTLAMLPPDGIDYELYQTLTTSGAVQLDQMRQKIVDRFINNCILMVGNRVEEENQDTEELQSFKHVKTVYMHPLVARHARNTLAKKDSKIFFNSICMNWTIKLRSYIDDWKLEKLGIHDKEYRHIPQIANACSYAESFLQEFGEHEEVFAERRSLLLKASDLCEKRGYIKDAVEYLERAVNVEGAYQEDFGKLLPRINSAAVLYYEGGKYKEAERLLITYLQILDDRNNITVEPDLENAGYDLDDLLELDDASKYGAAFNNLAVVCNVQGNYEKALEYYDNALEVRERILGSDHPSTATTYNNMAGVYKAQGEYEKALEYYGKVLEVRERVLGRGHPDTATTYNNMAGVYEDQGDYEKALEYYGKALEIVERILGSDHPSTATTYNNMAGVYQAQGDYEKALEYYGKDLEISEKVLGSDHPNTAATYNNMAGVYQDQGDYKKALEYYDKALKVRERVLGSDHPSTATTYNNMAGVYQDQGDYEKALEYYEKDLEISEKVLGSDHPSTATTYNNMAGVYKAKGDYEKALKFYEKAFTVFMAKLGVNHPYTQSTQLAVKIMKLCLRTGLNEDQLIEMIRNTPPEVLQERIQLFSNGIDHAGEDHSVS